MSLIQFKRPLEQLQKHMIKQELIEQYGSTDKFILVAGKDKSGVAVLRDNKIIGLHLL